MKKIAACIFAAVFMLTSANAASDWSAMRYKEPVTVSILLIDLQYTKQFMSVVADIERDLNIQTEIHLRTSDFNTANYLRSLLASGDVPDICTYNSGALFKALSPETYFVDLSNEAFVSEIEPVFLENVSVDGGIYGIPFGEMEVGCWLYNKEIHSRLGLQEPKTWDELMNNCEIIKSAGITPVVGGYSDAWTSQLILLEDHHNLLHEDPDFVDNYNAGKTGYSTNPNARRGFEKMAELFQKGYLYPLANEINNNSAIEMFKGGQVAYFPVLATAQSLLEFSAELEIGLFSQPGDDPSVYGTTIWLPQSICLSKTCKNEEAAKRWMAYYLSEDGMGGRVSFEDPGGASQTDSGAYLDSGYECIERMNAYILAEDSVLALEFTSPLKGRNLPQLAQKCATGMISPQEAAEEYDEELQRQALLLNLQNS